MLPVYAHAISDEPLPPGEAFKFTAKSKDANTIIGEWTIAQDYYLYHDKFQFRSDTPGIKTGNPSIPAGKKKKDEFFGLVETHRNKVIIEIPIERDADAPNTLKIFAKSQGCADLGICYPPYETSKTIQLASADSKTNTPLEAISQLGNSLGLQDDSEEFLDPDVAFALNTELSGDNTIIARWTIADGYYLYRDKFKFSLKDAPAGVSLGSAELPEGKIKNDEFFGRIAVFYHTAEARIPVNGATAGETINLEIGYQGCADAGLCYPPIFKTSSLTTGSSTASTIQPTAPSTEKPDQAPVTEQEELIDILKGGDTWLIIGVFFLAGLGLSLTPCVFPMIPILSGIIVGHGESITTRKAFTLSLVYVLAMALTYTAAGVVAGLFGENLQAMFQNPWILSAFAAVFVLLSLSMFGFYDLQVPSFLQSRLTEISNRQKGGSLTGVAIMGLLSALIVGPCVAAPLAGALIFIGNTGDAVLGGMALFALSIGMGVPLLIIGTTHGKVLPKAGPWMDAIKAVFGVLLLGVAIWMLERILPGEVVLILWALLLIVSAIYMNALDPLGPDVSGWKKFWKGLGIVMLLYGALLLIGGSMGAKDPLQPLQKFGMGSIAGATAGDAHALPFKPIKSLADLEREVTTANSQGKTVMVDFYADWCISCKEFEKYTFSDSGVQAALANTVMLQADVTANDETDKALLKHFKLIGPPTILFFNKQGKELDKRRVVGFMKAEEFKNHIQQTIQ
jgi:thiol:disulfide interchange protein DsbD